MRATSISASRRVVCHHQSRNGRDGAADGDEPEIVDARREHEEAVDLPLVLRERPHRVRREHDAVHGGEIGDRLERVEDLDVGVEVDDLARTAIEQEAKQQRLDRGRELGDVVDARQSPNLNRVQAEVGEPQPADRRRDRAGRKTAALIIDEQDCEPPARVVRQKRIGEHLRERKVVTRYDCARVQHG